MAVDDMLRKAAVRRPTGEENSIGGELESLYRPSNWKPWKFRYSFEGFYIPGSAAQGLETLFHGDSKGAKKWRGTCSIRSLSTHACVLAPVFQQESCQMYHKSQNAR